MVLFYSLGQNTDSLKLKTNILKELIFFLEFLILQRVNLNFTVQYLITFPRSNCWIFRRIVVLLGAVDGFSGPYTTVHALTVIIPTDMTESLGTSVFALDACSWVSGTVSYQFCIGRRDEQGTGEIWKTYLCISYWYNVRSLQCSL